MHAMTRNVPPHTPQCSISMWKRRLSRCIQRMGVRKARGGSPRLPHRTPPVLALGRLTWGRPGRTWGSRVIMGEPSPRLRETGGAASQVLQVLREWP